MRSLPLLLAASVLTAPGCASPPDPTGPTLQQGAAFVTAPILRPGCLLPDPKLLLSLTSPASVQLSVTVGDTGAPVDAVVLQSTGSVALDDAFKAAAVRCEFIPARAGAVSVAAKYPLSYAWEPRQRFLGPSSCFMVPYPRQAIRADESAEVQVAFKLPAGGGAVQTRVDSTPPSQRLSATSVEVVERCLAHPEARLGIQPDTWYAIRYVWRLED